MATNTGRPVAPTPLVAAGDAHIKHLYVDEDMRQMFREDLTAAAKAAFKKQEPDSRTRFHEQFRKEADEYDQGFRKRYHDDFNSTLIFAGLFSAVASAFIVDVQSQMRPDYNQMSFTVLTMLLNTTSGIPNQLPPPTWSGPSPLLVQVQSILFASLLSALLAAFLAMLGKQWLNLHVEGSFIDRNHHREQKMRGMITLRFKFIMEFLPLTLQASLLLLGYALARYLWDTSHTVSLVISVFTAVGVVLYLLIVVLGTSSRTSPFQTPVSVTIRAILDFYQKDINGVLEAVRNLFRFTRSQTGLIFHRQQLPTPSIPSDIDDQDSEVRAELSCILTMFKMTKAPDSVEAIMAYITEIVWDDRFKSVPLLPVYQALRESLFRSADGKVSPRPGARDRALWSAKALLHLYNQRRCIHRLDATLANQVEFIDHPNRPLKHDEFDKDFDLRSTFYIVDWTFGAQPEIPWSELRLSEPHHRWLAHMLRYRTWDVLSAGKKLPDDVRGFVVASLDSRSSHTSVVADCLFIVHMVAGRIPGPRDLREDRSHQISEIIDDIFGQLDIFFQQSNPAGTSSALDALELAVIFRDRRVCARSYSLFRTIMNKADKPDEMWTAARLCLQGAYSAGMVPQVKDLEALRELGVPEVGDPKQLLEFLHYHMQEGANVESRPVHLVFSALVVAPNDETDRGLATHNFTGSHLIDTMIKALEDKDSPPFQRSTIYALATFDSHLFAKDEAFRDRNKASRFVTAWSSAIHEFLGDPSLRQLERAVFRVLLAIAHLPCLRERLPEERWTLMKHYPLLLPANPPLQRCLDDPSILTFLKTIPDSGPSSLWFGALWANYHHLSSQVRDQLEQETREIAAGDNFYDLQAYIKMFDSNVKNLGDRIAELDPLDQTAFGLRARRERMKQAKDKLVSIMER